MAHSDRRSEFLDFYKMKKIFLLASTLLIALFLAGCAYYVEPSKNIPQATLHIVTDHHLGTRSGWSYYPEAQCPSFSGVSMGGFSTFYNGEKKLQIRAGETKYLVIKTTTSGGGGGAYSCGAPICIGEHYCIVEFELNPVAGKTYLARHSGNGYGCSVQITDEATGVPAEGVRQIKPDPHCK